MIVKAGACAGLSYPKIWALTREAEAGKEPGNLPLLAYALKQLFESDKGRNLTAVAYQAHGWRSGRHRAPKPIR